VLVSFGATWDAKCDALVSSGKARKEAPALRICMLLWTQELVDGLPFTTIPVEVIQRGVDSTQVYSHDLKLEKKKNLERLLKASEKGDVAAVRALLESGNVEVNGAMRCVCFLLCARIACDFVLNGRVDSVQWMHHAPCELTDACALHLIHALSERKDPTSLCVIARSFGSRGVARGGRRGSQCG
jgi:hypothetical protein